LVRAALAAIPNPDLPYEKYLEIFMATFASTDGSDEGLDAFDEWARQSTKYNVRENTRRRWERMRNSPPTEYSFGTLHHLATRADPDWLGRYDLKLMNDLNRADGYAEEIPGWPSIAPKSEIAVSAIAPRVRTRTVRPSSGSSGPSVCS
jgi:hypothetical protein